MSVLLSLPAGTQVVTRSEVHDVDNRLVCPQGAVGIVIEAPPDGSGMYRVRFLDGNEALLHRRDLTVRKHFHRTGLSQLDTASSGIDLHNYIIYRCVVGSRAYGLDEADSDTDRRGIYLPPATLHWSLQGVPEQLEDHVTRDTYWELQKFLVMALKANPNILECLYTPLVEAATPLAQELLAIRSRFLSKLVYQTYNGYVMSQFLKLEQDLRTTGNLKWKHAMHLIRLLLSGIQVLEEGTVPVRVEQHREQLLAIRRGEVPWDAINAWRLGLHKTFDAAFATTRLPEQPDYTSANDFLIRARRSMVMEGQ